MTATKGVILVVDDEPDSLSLLSTILSSEAYMVRPADSGALAVASATRTPPDLILLDMRMPGMDGLEVCRQLKVRAETREVPIMFVSGSADVQGRVEALELGAVDFVVKPFERAELVARIGTHLELSRLRVQLEREVLARTEQLRDTVCQLRQEVAEHRRTEQALRESEERFRSMADTVPVMIVTSDADGQATFFNNVWLDFTGRSSQEELGMGWIDNVHPDDLEACREGIAASFEQRKRCLLKYRLRRRDGEYRSFLCNGIPRFRPEGAFLGYIVSLVDITDMERSQETLQEYKERLQDLAAGLLLTQESASRKLARELHDVFSQDLAAIGSRIYDFQNTQSDPAVGRALSELGSSVLRLAQDLHHASRRLHPSIVEDLGLKHAVADECETFQQRSGISTRLLTRNLPAHLSSEICLCLYRVTQESLRNIGKHADASSVKVVLTGNAKGVELRIEDSGKGFDVSQGLKKGLGLISMQERVRLVNGNLTIRSTPGRGTSVAAAVPHQAPLAAVG